MAKRLNPDTTYMPTLLQQIFHSVAFTYVYYYGANQAGKSRAAINMALQWASGENTFLPSPSPCVIWIISPDFKQGKSALFGHRGVDERFAEFTKWLPFYEHLKPKVNRNAYTVVFQENGSLIEFKSNQSGDESLAGAKIHLAIYDEPPDQSVFDEITIRTIAYQGLIRGAMTATKGISCWTNEAIWEQRGEPWGTREQIEYIIGKEWVSRLAGMGVARFGTEGYLLNHAKSGPYPALWYNEDKDQLVINPSIYDNINQESGSMNLVRREIEKKERNLHSKAARMIRLDGQPAMHEGLVFDIWNPAKHLIDEIDIPEHWDHYLGVDYGSTKEHVFAGMHMVLSPDGTWYVIDEYINDTGASFRKCAREMNAQWPGVKWMACVDDSRGKMHRYSLQEEGIYPVPTKAKPDERYQKVYELLEDDRMYVFRDRCPRLETEMRKFAYPDQSRRNVPTSAPLKKFNDAIDAIGGIATWPHLPPAKLKENAKKTDQDYWRERIAKFEERETSAQVRHKHLRERGGETGWFM